MTKARYSVPAVLVGKATSESGELPVGPATPVDILVVDDRPADAAALRAVLDDPGYQVVTVDSGQDALRQVLQRDFAVILLDVVMPRLDGFELATMIKQRERSQHTPIIFLTAASVDVSKLYRAYSVGAIDYLIKPVDPHIVRAKVAVFAALFRQDRALRQHAERERQAERARREFELAKVRDSADRRYRNLAEAVPQIVWTADAYGGLEYCNRRWVEYTGVPVADARGDRWLALVHPDDVEEYHRHWRHALFTQSDCDVKFRLRGQKDGAYRWHLCRAVPERDDLGRVTAWLGTFTDFEDLILAIQARDEFMSIASHELRTPLTALKLQIQSLLQSHELSEAARRKAESVERQSERVERLVGHLLDVARIATGQLGVELEPFALGEAVTTVVERFQSNPLPGQPPIRLRVQDPCCGNWDRLRIEQVITNLLVNAISYGDGNPIEVVVKGSAHAARFWVADRGRGIAPNDQTRIFQRFGRVGEPRTKGGLGMGLYIAHQIVAAHRGTIHVESKLGFGSTFIVTLPDGPSEPAPCEQAQ
jgi:PAS domain S-box-containing protein